jgi:hypothetical protein
MSPKFLLVFVVTFAISVYSIFYSYQLNPTELVFTKAETHVSIVENRKLNVETFQTFSNNATAGRLLRDPELYYLKKYPFFLKCNQYYLNRTEGIENVSIPFNYSRPAENYTHSLRISRAVIVYYPIDKLNHFEYEFRWLYRSWINMIGYEPSKWRTDLVVFVKDEAKYSTNASFFLNQLNCSFHNLRRLAMDPPMCTLINYISINQRSFESIVAKNKFANDNERYQFILKNVDIYNQSEANTDKFVFYDLLQKNLANYNYVDSILMAFDGYEYFKSAGFDFLIRSDMDVFLTPLFGRWLPRYCNDFYVGRGGYSSEFNSKRFPRIAKDLGFEYAGRHNLGSTWYSTPEQFRIVAYLTLFGMAYVANEEFTKPEREGKVGTILWPDWHYGVLLLYGQHMALNHLIGSDQLFLTKLEDHIDFPSGNDESVFKHLHIHVFHSDNMFSKFVYRAGKYDQILVRDEDQFKVKFYCLKMALDAKRIMCSDMYKMLLNETRRKS